jgi:hypothetical protein
MEKSTNLLIGILAGVFFSIVSAQSLRADTYTVTSASLTGSGSFLEAIERANNHPGPDIIEFTPGLQVDASGDNPVSLNDYVIANITESVVIDGKGGALNGRQTWINGNGTVNNPSQCPQDPQFNGRLLEVMPGFLSIGKYNQDNSGIQVTVKNLSIKQFNQVASVKKNAALGLENFTAIQTWATFKCQGDALIEVGEGASLTIRKSELNGFYNWAREGLAAVIVGIGAGDLIIEESRFNRLEDGDNYFINWVGQPGSVVNIVGSRITWSGGITITGDVSHTNIVNSIWTSYFLFDPDYADRFRNVSTGDMNFIASTLVWNSNQCDPLCQNFPSYALIDRLGSGKINFKGTAIGFNFIFDSGSLINTLGDAGTGGFTADAYTWIQPTVAQDAEALKTITGQPNLRTNLPAFNQLVISTTEDFDLKLATPAFPGELIDVIPATEVLINPITNSLLTVDVVGNPRNDANGYRDIGALQLGLAPNLVVSGTGDGSVDLSWNEPLHHDGLAINGYEVRYFLPGASSPAGAVGGISGLGVNVANLMNGTDYTFEVRAIYAGPVEGPWSNRVTATPYGALGTPAVTATAGDGEVALQWTQPDLGGRAFSAYTILWRVAGTDAIVGAQATYGYDQTAITIAGLQNGTKYEFAVAVNVTGAVSAQGKATATPWPVPFLSYATPVTVSENSVVSLFPHVGQLSQTPLFLPDGGTLPAGLALDTASGEITGITGPGSAGTYTFKVLLSQAGLPSNFNVTAELDITVVATPPDLRLHYPDIDVPAGSGPLNVAPTVTGSQGGTLGFAMVPGDVLPDGLVLDPQTGQITGTPTTATDGFRGLTVGVTEQTGSGSRVANSPLIVRIQPTLSYAPVEGEVGDSITATPNVSASAIPGTYAITAGTLPRSLSFDTATGVVSGIPLLPDFEILTVSFTLSGEQTQVASAALGIAISSYAIDFSYPRQTLTIGQPFSLVPVVSGTKGTRVFAVDGGTLPSGLSLDPNTGEISGTMTSALNGTFPRIRLTDSYSSALAEAVLEGVFPVSTPVPTFDRLGVLLLVLLVLGLGVNALYRVD